MDWNRSKGDSYHMPFNYFCIVSCATEQAIYSDESWRIAVFEADADLQVFLFHVGSDDDRMASECQNQPY